MMGGKVLRGDDSVASVSEDEAGDDSDFESTHTKARRENVFVCVSLEVHDMMSSDASNTMRQFTALCMSCSRSPQAAAAYLTAFLLATAKLFSDDVSHVIGHEIQTPAPRNTDCALLFFMKRILKFDRCASAQSPT